MFKLSITAKFFIPIITASLLLSVVLSFFVNKIVKQSLIERAESFIADHTLSHVFHLLTAENFLSSDYQSQEQSFLNFSKIIKTPEILRIKVWNNQGRVIFSDDKSIIGKDFKDNEEYGEAMGGRIAAEIQKPIKEENVGEAGYGQLLEVYVPINFSNSEKPNGVIEIYYKMDSVNKMVADSEYKIFALVLGEVFVLFIFLWYFFHIVVKASLLKLKNASYEIAGGKFDKKVDIKTKDELGDLAVSFNKMADEINRRQKELVATNLILEQKVKERLEPYEEKIKELENKVFDLEKTKNNLEDKLKNYI